MVSFSLTLGNINWNKCADRVIEAIGAGPELRDATEYKLVGSIEPEERSRLCGLADRLGVRLVVAGPVNDDELVVWVDRAISKRSNSGKKSGGR